MKKLLWGLAAVAASAAFAASAQAAPAGRPAGARPAPTSGVKVTAATSAPYRAVTTTGGATNKVTKTTVKPTVKPAVAPAGFKKTTVTLKSGKAVAGLNKGFKGFQYRCWSARYRCFHCFCPWDRQWYFYSTMYGSWLPSNMIGAAPPTPGFVPDFGGATPPPLPGSPAPPAPDVPEVPAAPEEGAEETPALKKAKGY